eukprot:9335912-Pyramimonas_sp.AAC.1
MARRTSSAEHFLKRARTATTRWTPHTAPRHQVPSSRLDDGRGHQLGRKSERGDAKRTPTALE